MTEYETVPVTIQYNDNEPLDIDGRVVGVLNATAGSRRTTLLVEKPVTDAEDSTEDSQGVMNFPDDGESVEVEGVTEEEHFVNFEAMDYRDLQSLAKEQDIPANQSSDELVAALKEAIQ